METFLFISIITLNWSIIFSSILSKNLIDDIDDSWEINFSNNIIYYYSLIIIKQKFLFIHNYKNEVGKLIRNKIFIFIDKLNKKKWW